MKGWIKLHRQIQSHWVFENEAYFRAWIIILMEVNHSENKVLIGSSLYELKSGQSLNSLDTWVSKFGSGWTKQKVRTFFSLLKNDKMINTINERKTTRLTVCNYETYQTEQHANNTESNTQITCEQHANNMPVTPNKNEKKVKNEKKSYKKFSEDEFRHEVWTYKEKYESEMLGDFFRYWIEQDCKGKMRFQLQPTWSTGGRLATWHKNNLRNNYGNKPEQHFAAGGNAY